MAAIATTVSANEVLMHGAFAHFVGRQAIFDRSLNVKAYELLYRSGDVDAADVRDGVQATADVLATCLVDIGLDRVAEKKQIFINVERDFLMGPHALPVSPDQVVLEILEDVDVDHSLVAAVAALRKEGFGFALDDYTGDSKWEPLMPFIDTVKVDVRAVPVDEVAREVAALRRWRVRLLAEKVETQEEFDTLKAIGFDLFQGYFLSRPKTVEGQRLPASQQTLVHLLAAVRDPDLDPARLVRLIENDAGLSFRLLRFLNSARFLLYKEVNSIERAVVWMGIEGLRRWVSLICLAGGGLLSPELMRLSMVRAKFCEVLDHQACGNEQGAAFTMGMFSNLDAIMQAPLKIIIDEIPLSDGIRQALIKGDGPLHPLLQCAFACERFDWRAVQDLPFEPRLVRDAHVEATWWADEMMAQLGLGG